ncbi:DUF3566 domain-containing protein [Arthrobacter sp. H14-L1]|uniref:DUF3566 domain-containing protein n=1 Tax=Arthrobacter sp. H14-L1 TaxID=2996697 RepID=UPI00226D6CD7|nr:DUF3566 domain-containing protein [Arthrobacter sp. H14-L1]
MLGRPTQPRRARVFMSKVSPWKVLQITFLFSIALGILTVAVRAGLWMVLDATGLLEQLSVFLTGVVGTSSGFSVDLRHTFPLNQVAAVASIIALVDVVLISVLAVLGSAVYNFVAVLGGGVEVTLTDGYATG